MSQRLKQSAKYVEFVKTIKAYEHRYGYIPHGVVSNLAVELGVPSSTARNWLKTMGMRVSAHGVLDPIHEMRVIDHAMKAIRNG